MAATIRPPVEICVVDNGTAPVFYVDGFASLTKDRIVRAVLYEKRTEATPGEVICNHTQHSKIANVVLLFAPETLKEILSDLQALEAMPDLRQKQQSIAVRLDA